MKLEHQSENKKTQQTAAADACVLKSTAPPIEGPAGGAAIDFHAAEFNYIDDLNDYSGDCRSFEPLDGIVTADMRHQAQRREMACAPVAAIDPEPEELNEPESEAADAPEIAPPLMVISRGRTLIIDTDAGRALACGKLLSDQQLNCTLLVIKNAVTDSVVSNPGGMPMLEAEAASVRGAFGCFTAIATAAGKQKPLTKWLGGAAEVFDLVLDLQNAASFAGDRLPAGYYAPGADPEILQDALAQMPLMIGRFQKPQFTVFSKKNCFHGRSRVRECRHCLEACPVGAIKSADGQIFIDHYICQGCGVCSLVCPANAIAMSSPSGENLLNNLRSKLEVLSMKRSQGPTLIITDLKNADGDSLPDPGEEENRAIFAVEEIGYVGLEVLLTSLAYGTQRVVVACGLQNPPAVRSAVERQIQMAAAILTGLNLPEDKVQFTATLPPNDDSLKTISPAAGALSVDSHAPFPEISASINKRRLVRLATQYLHEQSGTPQESIELPVGSPFGCVTVNAAPCTLCMACVLACPSGALTAGGDTPKLEFIEARCHQCGLCKEACPEKAVQLLPRLLCNAPAAEIPATIKEAEPFRCVECGVPFATQGMIDRMRDKLQGHRMYASERQLRRLSLCGTCRTRDALLAEDASWTRR